MSSGRDFRLLAAETIAGTLITQEARAAFVIDESGKAVAGRGYQELDVATVVQLEEALRRAPGKGGVIAVIDDRNVACVALSDGCVLLAVFPATTGIERVRAAVAAARRSYEEWNTPMAKA